MPIDIDTIQLIYKYDYVLTDDNVRVRENPILSSIIKAIRSDEIFGKTKLDSNYGVSERKFKNFTYKSYWVNFKDDAVKIEFKSKFIKIRIKISKFLYGRDNLQLTQSDLEEFIRQYNIYKTLFLNFSKSESYSEKLIRVDYKLDFKLSDNQKKNFVFRIIQQNLKSIPQIYPTGIRARADNASWNIYYRYAKLQSDYAKKHDSKYLHQASFWEDIYRLEFQTYTNKYIKKFGFSQELVNYLCQHTFDLIYTTALFNLIGHGKHYKANIITRLLNGCKNKQILLTKLSQIQHNPELKPKKVLSNTQRKQLANANVNPIQLNISFNIFDHLAHGDDIDLLQLLKDDYKVTKILEQSRNSILFNGWKWGKPEQVGVYRFNASDLEVKLVA